MMMISTEFRKCRVKYNLCRTNLFKCGILTVESIKLQSSAYDIVQFVDGYGRFTGSHYLQIQCRSYTLVDSQVPVSYLREDRCRYPPGWIQDRPRMLLRREKSPPPARNLTNYFGRPARNFLIAASYTEKLMQSKTVQRVYFSECFEFPTSSSLFNALKHVLSLTN